MLCILNGIDKNTFDAGLDTALVALAFEEPVDVVLIIKPEAEIGTYHRKLAMLQQSGLGKIFIVGSSHTPLDIPIETQMISSLELRSIALKHHMILSF